ncbi:MAG: GntR family transcriptional regulator [Pseudomonadota bacterium]
MKRPPSARLTKAEMAFQRLEAAVVNCDIAPGTVLVEADLVEMLEVGRTPVREALVKRSAENLVRLGRGGLVIPELNTLTMLQLLELRAPIERLCIEKAIARQTATDREAFEAIKKRLSALAPEDRAGFMELLRRVHAALAAASKNDFILSALKTTQGLSRPFWRYFATDEDQRFSTEL